MLIKWVTRRGFSTSSVVRPLRQKVLRTKEAGDILLFYHKPSRLAVPALYLKYIVPFGGLIYLIRKNPFYKRMPVALPLMMVAAIALFLRIVRFSSKTNVLISEIWLDRSASELTFTFQNARWRTLTGEPATETRLVQQMRNPPQGEDYRLLPGPLFPEKYPFPYGQLFEMGYFWHKYFISQRLFYCLPKRPYYANYELLVNCFNGASVDISEAEYVEIPHSTLKPSKELLQYLWEANQYTKEKFDKRLEKIQELQVARRKKEQEINKPNPELDELNRRLKTPPKLKQKKQAEEVFEGEEDEEAAAATRTVRRSWLAWRRT